MAPSNVRLSPAYRMLGSLSEADDAVQEAWLRLARTDTSDVDNLAAWLTTVVARVCLNTLRTRQHRREEPLDVRVPDPIITPAGELNPLWTSPRPDEEGFLHSVTVHVFRGATDAGQEDVVLGEGRAMVFVPRWRLARKSTGSCRRCARSAHSSYRVTGNAVATGEAAGVGAAVAAASGRLPHELSFSEIADPLAKLRQS